ncbi:MAG: hypothetical protein WA417_15820, partial [Stellaceae bacterium]
MVASLPPTGFSIPCKSGKMASPLEPAGRCRAIYRINAINATTARISPHHRKKGAAKIASSHTSLIQGRPAARRAVTGGSCRGPWYPLSSAAGTLSVRHARVSASCSRSRCRVAGIKIIPDPPLLLTIT